MAARLGYAPRIRGLESLVLLLHYLAIRWRLVESHYSSPPHVRGRLTRTLNRYMVAGDRVELSISGYEPDVLPLH